MKVSIQLRLIKGQLMYKRNSLIYCNMLNFQWEKWQAVAMCEGKMQNDKTKSHDSGVSVCLKNGTNLSQ